MFFILLVIYMMSYFICLESCLNIQCQEGIKTMYKMSFQPIKKVQNSTSTDYEIKEKLQKKMQLVGMFDLKKQDQNVSPKFWFLSYNDLLLVYFYEEKELYEFVVQKVYLEMDENISKFEFIITNRQFVKFQNVPIITHSFNQMDSWFIICQDKNLIYIYVLDFVEEFSEQIIENPQLINTFKKNAKCDYHIAYYQYYQQLIVAELFCQNWNLYIIQHQNQTIFDSNYFDNQPLQKVNQIQNIIHLVFSHSIYQIYAQNFIIIQIFQNDEWDNNIIDYQISNQALEIIIVEDSQFSGEQQNRIIQKNYRERQYVQIITMEKPKQIIIQNQFLIFLVEKNYNQQIFNHYDNIIQIEVDYMETEQKLQQIYFGLNQSYFVVYRVNYYSPLINCDDYIDQTIIHLGEKSLFKKTAVLSCPLQFIAYDQEYLVKLNEKPLQLKLYGKKFSFQLNSNEYIQNNVLPKINFINQNFLTCEESHMQINIQNINLKQYKIIWQIIIEQNDYLFFVFQTKELLLYLYESNTNQLKYLGILEEINKKNIKFKKYQLIVIHNNNKKLLIVDLEQYPKVSQYVMQFSKQIITVQHNNKYSFLLLENCVVVQQIHQKFSQIHEFLKLKKINFALCNQSYFFDETRIFKFTKNKITMITDLGIFNQNFMHEEIIDCFNIFRSNYQIMLVKQQNEVNLYKYFYFNVKFVKLFKLPLLKYQITEPIKYVQNGQNLILLVESKEQKNKLFLLIYILKNDFKNILYDIIEGVQNDDFDFASENSIYYHKNNNLYMYKIGQIQFSCQIKQMDFITKQINQSLILTSKLNSTQQIYDSLILIIQNNVKNLSPKISRQFFKQNKNEKFDLDVRELVFGQISSIKSNDFNIELPLQLSKFISKQLCPIIQRNLCLNYDKGYIITNLNDLTQQNFSYTEEANIFFEFGLLVVQDLKKQKIQIFDKNSYYLGEFEFLNPYKIQKIVYQNELLYLLSSEAVQVFNILTLKQIALFHVLCYDCEMQNIINKNQTWILYSKILNSKHLYMITDKENNIIQFQELQILIANSSDNFLEFQSIELIELFEYDTYINAMVFICQNQITYIYDGIIDKNKNEFYLSKRNGIIRVIQPDNQKNNYFSKKLEIFSLLQKDLLFTVDCNSNFGLYNLSNYYNFQLIDSIYQLRIQNKTAKKINNTHIILISQNDKPHEIYYISSYQFQIKNVSNNKNKFQIYNDVSEVEFEIIYQEKKLEDSKMLYLYCVLIIIICFSIYFIRRCKLKKNKNYQRNYKS